MAWSAIVIMFCLGLVLLVYGHGLILKLIAVRRERKQQPRQSLE